MVIFDGRTPGTPEAEWATSRRLAELPPLDLGGVDRVVVVSAHPDDESLAAGGLLARVAGLGMPVQLVVATNGEASHPSSPSWTPERLAARRRRELLDAVGAVAPDAEVRFLDLPDGRLRAHADELRVALSALGVGTGALVVAPWRSDAHGDHETAGTIAAAVALEAGARLLEYPVWMWHWATPDAPEVPWRRLVRLELTDDERAAKARAISAHMSQNAPLSPAPGDELMLTSRFHEYFARPFEVFVGPPAVGSLTEHFFDTFYDGRDDPWGFESRWYEIRKRAITVASLPRPLFTSALEIGCSIGVLTEELSGRSARLLALDIADQPLVRARARLADQPHVTFRRLDAAHDWPEGSFDLIVLSEVAYYWSRDDLRRVLERIDAALTGDGVLVACHWRHPVDGYPERGDDVHRTIRSYPAFEVLAAHEEEDFLLDVLTRRPAVSVARETGLM